MFESAQERFIAHLRFAAAGAGAELRDFVFEPSGAIVATGCADVGLAPQIGLARFTASGTLDDSYGTKGSGLTMAAAGKESSCGRAIVRLADGRHLVVGTASAGLDADIVLARFNP